MMWSALFWLNLLAALALLVLCAGSARAGRTGTLRAGPEPAGSRSPAPAPLREDQSGRR